MNAQPDHSSTFGTSKNGPALTPRRKAAIIVHLLLGDGGKLNLASLPPPLQELLASELAAIRLVDRETVNSVAAEFTDLLGAVGLSSPGGADAAVAALADHISPGIADTLRKRIKGEATNDPWVALADLGREKLLPAFHAEGPEACAIILSKLPVDLAADILGALDGPRARLITHTMSRVTDTPADLIAFIGQHLVSVYGAEKPVTFTRPPAPRMGDILNATAPSTRDDMLAGLDAEDADFASAVRQSIFTFEDITTRLRPTDISACLRGVDPTDQTTALAFTLAQSGPLNEAAEFLLAGMSQRMAQQLREDAVERGDVKTPEGEAAMSAITRAIRGLLDAGDITLLPREAPQADNS